MRIPLAALAAVLSVCARAQVLVNEAGIRAHLVNGKTVVTLALDNERDKPVHALVELRWLGPANELHGLATANITAAPGQSSVEIPIPLSEKMADPLPERLSYRIDADRTNLTAFESVRGIVSFVQIAGYAFSLRIIAPNVVQPDTGYELRVLTFHPASGGPVSGVSIQCGKSVAVSNKDGIAILHMASGEDENDQNYIIKARIGDFSRVQDAPDIQVARRQVHIQCDKPIYQPGQTMHIRILALAPNGKAEGAAEHTLRIFDENEDVEYATALTTSRFGIAATDWEIPGNAKSGEYRLQVDNEGEENEDLAIRMVRIRRYELPSFRVGVNLDRTYYLSRQKATIEVRGDYLFGKPVNAGKVRITEGDDETRVSEGDLNADGRFQTTLDVGEPQFGDTRFIDRHFTAFVTDSSTSRTEQHKFDLRVSRDPLHLYIAKEEGTPKGQRIYVTTYLPDGTPARSDVTVLIRDQVLTEGETNRFGLVRLDVPTRSGEFVVRAITKDGKHAEQTQPFFSTGNAIWLETNRKLYRPGEAIQCRISGSDKSATVLLLAWNSGGQVLFSRDVQLRDGNAAVEIPYDRKFGKELAISVVSGALGSASRAVLFPRAEDLGLRIMPVKNEYRPGDTAKIEFRASTQAALGIAIVDQSVFERASTDAAFGPRRWFDFEANEQNSLAGITYSDLLSLDPGKIDEALHEVAEVLIDDPPARESVGNSLERPQFAYLAAAQRDLGPVKNALDDHYLSTLDYPRDEQSYFQMASAVRDPVLDPWMKPYFPRFSTEGPNGVLRICSAGPDKRAGTDDDFCALEIERRWFARFESVIRDSLIRLEDYPATNEELIELLDRAGVRFDRLIDPWGTHLRCSIAHERNQRVIRIASAGPDRQWGTPDDFVVVEFRGSYFSSAGEKIEAALKAAKQFPRSDSEFRAALAAAGLNFDELHDPWGRRYYADFHSEESYYDRPQVYTYEEYQGLRESRKELIPSKRTFLVADIKSVGEDGLAGTDDDFAVTSFFRAVNASLPKPKDETQSSAPRLSRAGTGAIAGVIVDPSGAVVANARITLNDTYTTQTNGSGKYIFSGMRGGYFRLRFEAPGFQTGVLDHVPVEPDHVTKADFTLQVASVSQTVEVMAAPNTIPTSLAEVAAQPGATLATPHVREYFPETLYWNPELITNTAGYAAMNVKLADTITTWHMAIVASSEDGRITEMSADLRAFQPFQVDLDLPPVLTEGDQIKLPVPLRNYLAQPQSVRVSAQPGGGLTLENLSEQPASIAASGTANVMFSLRAATSGEDAHLRVSAIAGGASDAIEKPTVVHPDGERLEKSVSGIAGKGQLLRMDLPSGVIPGSLRGEIKLYPTLTARLLEAMQALLQRPYGCGEQTISSAYPNLLFLRAMKRGGLQDVKLEARAMRNLKLGYARLLGYQSDQGGFQYWASGEPDAALTAYALSFLTDAKEFLEVDSDRVDSAQKWLKRQSLNENSVRGFTLWALVHSSAPNDTETVRKLGELARKAAEFEDPYAIAAFALAAMDSGRADLAESSIRRLTELARDEEGTAYWALRANTPFHGWGRAGQVETTALVVSALARWQKLGKGGTDLKQLIDRGALFLLKNTDSSGAWSSSQATVRALLALIEISPAVAQGDPSEVEVLVNGSSAGRIALGNGRHTISGPGIIDVSHLVRPGATNEVSVRSDGTEPLQLQFNAVWYEHWSHPRTVKDFTMDAELTTTEAAVNQAVTCRVKITRPAFRGYGMMIAEIGLPPGVDVDRGTLASVIDDPKSGVDSFEVAPDQVTFYVWPRASDSSFQFVFRPRFAMKARMAQSALYDYYNPDERVLLVPQAFTAN